jgi:hypothetical protein
MLRKVMLGLAGAVLVVVVGTVAAAGYLYASWKSPPAQRELAVSEAERYLLAAAREGDAELVAGLINAGTPVNIQDDRGVSPLILAAYHGHTETVRALLAGGADACAGDSRGNTALMGAAFKGYVEVVDLLLQQPCAVDQSNGVGQTALMFARLFGRKEVADRLQQQGASAERRDASGRTAEDWARTQAPESPVSAPNSLARSAATRVVSQ